jgi:hypothetical protein
MLLLFCQAEFQQNLDFKENKLVTFAFQIQIFLDYYLKILVRD